MKRLLLVLALSWSFSSFAQNCERPEGTAASGVATKSDQERLQFLQKLLVEESGRARTWTLAWGATYGILTVAQLSIMPLFPKEEQPDWYWGAFSTGVGVAFTVLGPLEVLEGGPRFEQRVKTTPPDETCALIAEGERMLKEGAEAERGNVQWYIHAANVAFNVGLGLILGLGYGRWTSGLINMGVGVAIGEATIFTSPQHLISGWKHYREGGDAQAVRLQVVPTAGPGIGLVLTF